jgi:hypothetical protein
MARMEARADAQIAEANAADLNRPIGEVQDPAQRTEITCAEGEARDATRAPFCPYCGTLD